MTLILASEVTAPKAASPSVFAIPEFHYGTLHSHGQYQSEVLHRFRTQMVSSGLWDAVLVRVLLRNV